MGKLSQGGLPRTVWLDKLPSQHDLRLLRNTVVIKHYEKLNTDKNES